MIVLKSPNTTLVISGIASLDERALAAAGKGLKAGLELIAMDVQLHYLTGPRPLRLGVVSGRLRGSISTKVENTGDKITGTIGTNVVYAARHEYGFNGWEVVQGYTRATKIDGFKKVQSRVDKKSGKLRKSSALYVIDAQGNIVGYKNTLRGIAAELGLIAQTSFQGVKAHTRKAHTPARPFLQPAIEAGAQKTAELINQAVAQLKPE